MGDRTKIEWSDATWNPVTGCDKVSPGCDHCYAETIATRFSGTDAYPDGFKVTLRPDRLDQPLRWRRPRRVFVNSMSDLFHTDIPDEYIARVWAVMALAGEHTFQVLTKRHGRMRSLVQSERFAWLTWHTILAMTHERAVPVPEATSLLFGHGQSPVSMAPLPNVWLGVSVEDQKRADLRIPALLETPAAVRFLSCEPLLGPVDLAHTFRSHNPGDEHPWDSAGKLAVRDVLHWVIVGGESGPAARPMHPDWARSLRDQCTTAGIPYFFKQWGEWAPTQVEMDEQFAGGLAFNHPCGGRQAVAVRRPGRTGTMRTAVTAELQPGERTRTLIRLDDHTVSVKVGKRAAGRSLDGTTWDQTPNRPTGIV